MTPSDLIDDLRSRINPIYQNHPGTESYERRQCVDALVLQQSEIERLRQRVSELDGQLGKRPCQNDRCLNYNRMVQNAALGAAIQKAAAELPEDYDMTIELERNAGIVALWIPPVSDEEGGRRVTDFCGDNLAEHIENAIGMAIEHHDETHNDLDDGQPTGCASPS